MSTRFDHESFADTERRRRTRRASPSRTRPGAARCGRARWRGCPDLRPRGPSATSSCHSPGRTRTTCRGCSAPATSATCIPRAHGAVDRTRAVGCHVGEVEVGDSPGGDVLGSLDQQRPRRDRTLLDRRVVDELVDRQVDGLDGLVRVDHRQGAVERRVRVDDVGVAVALPDLRREGPSVVVEVGTLCSVERRDGVDPQSTVFARWGMPAT